MMQRRRVILLKIIMRCLIRMMLLVPPSGSEAYDPRCYGRGVVRDTESRPAQDPPFFSRTVLPSHQPTFPNPAVTHFLSPSM